MSPLVRVLQKVQLLGFLVELEANVPDLYQGAPRGQGQRGMRERAFRGCLELAIACSVAILLNDPRERNWKIGSDLACGAMSRCYMASTST